MLNRILKKKPVKAKIVGEELIDVEEFFEELNKLKKDIINISDTLVSAYNVLDPADFREFLLYVQKTTHEQLG